MSVPVAIKYFEITATAVGTPDFVECYGKAMGRSERMEVVSKDQTVAVTYRAYSRYEKLYMTHIMRWAGKQLVKMGTKLPGHERSTLSLKFETQPKIFML